MKVWRDIEEKGLEIIRRASIFLAALAIKQNSSHIAIEILSTIKEARYMHVRCLKIVAYTDLKRFTDIVPLIRSSLEQDRPNGRKECFFNDVVCIQSTTFLAKKLRTIHCHIICVIFLD